MIDPTRNWTAEQAVAIEARHDEAVIVAGAGSGKTGVLAECVALSVTVDKLVTGEPVKPSEVLAITFTRKAAAEMRDRIRSRTLALIRLRDGLDTPPPIPDEEPEVSTIDGFCQGMVRRNALELGIDPRFKIVDESDPELVGRAWAVTLERFQEKHGQSALELLANYDDNPRASLESNIRSVHARLRTGGEEHPRLGVPDEAQAKASVEVTLETAKALAQQFLAESSDWATNKTIENRQAEAELISIMTPHTAQSAPDKFNAGTGKLLGDSAVRAELHDALGILAGQVANLRALPDLTLIAALLEEWDLSYAEMKADAGLLDFSDLALLSLRILRERRDSAAKDGKTGDWRPVGARFQRVFLDEAQDINRIQSELIGLISPEGKYYSVGDVAQSIYRFRHAEVEIFEQRANELGGRERRFELTTNFRSRSPILETNNHIFDAQNLEGLLTLTAGEANVREDNRVELILEDRDQIKAVLADEHDPPVWLDSIVGNGWRDAEAAAVARRIKDLLDDETAGYAASDVTVLARAVSGLKPFAEALRSFGIPATIEGAGGLWIRPEVSDLVALLASTGNACHEERFFHMLYSPICGLSVDALVLVAGEARGKEVPLIEALGTVVLDDEDAAIRDRFVPWFAQQRALAGRRSLSDAIEAALIETGYDLYLLGLPAGDRRFANVRRMQALASAWEAEHGADPAAFAREADLRLAGADNKRDGEAVVEQSGGSEGAVRLMTIHQAKGLQFPLTVLVDLGRGANNDSAVLSVSADGSNLLFRWREMIGAKAVATFADQEFVDQEKASDVAEEMRIMYVGFTRPQRRLILSGTFSKGPVDAPKPQGAGGSNTNLSRMIDAELIPGLATHCAGAGAEGEPGAWTETYLGGATMDVTVDSGQGLEAMLKAIPQVPATSVEPNLHPVEGALNPKAVPLRPSSLSYSGLQTAGKCAFRWYAENIIELSPVGEARSSGPAPEAGLRPNERGVILHGLLENAPLDGSVPTAADAKAEADIADISITDEEASRVSHLAAGIIGSKTWARLSEISAGGGRVSREEGFVVKLDCGDDSIPLRGIFDVFAVSDGGGPVVVDWKTSAGATEAEDLEALVARDYSIQREAYGLAALSSAAVAESGQGVEVIHLYAERPDEPVSVRFTSDDLVSLASSLGERATPLLAGNVPVTEKPWVGTCSGCPARGRLCSWDLEATDRLVAPDG